MTKNLIGVLVFMFAYTFCFSQNENIGVQPINVYLKFIKTDIDTPNAIQISTNIYYPYADFITNKIYTSQFDKNGQYYLKLNSFNFFLGNNQSVLVSPGDTVLFTYQGTKFKLLGNNEKYQNFAWYKKNEFDNKYAPPFKKVNELSLKDYKEYCISYFSREQDYIINYFGEKQQLLKEYLLNQSKYSLIINLFDGIKNKNYPKEIVGEDYLNFFDTSVYNHPGIFIDYFYGTAVDDYNCFMANMYNNTTSPEKYLKLINNAKLTFSKPVYAFLLMRYMRNISRWGNALYETVVQKINNELKTFQMDNATHKKMLRCYADFKLLSRNIKDFNTVKLKNIYGRNLHLSNIIEKNKYTFIDFWASWCGACLPELPYIKKAQEKYPQIKFINLSIDANQKAWKETSNRYNLSTTHSFLLVDGLNSKITSDFNIQSIPRFLLFDNNGNIINASNVHPSDTLFSNFLKQQLK